MERHTDVNHSWSGRTAAAGVAWLPGPDPDWLQEDEAVRPVRHRAGLQDHRLRGEDQGDLRGGQRPGLHGEQGKY